MPKYHAEDRGKQSVLLRHAKECHDVSEETVCSGEDNLVARYNPHLQAWSST